MGNYPEDYAGEVLGEMYGSEFFFPGGGGICLLKISKRRNFLGEISQGNVWGFSGRNVA